MRSRSKFRSFGCPVKGPAHAGAALPAAGGHPPREGHDPSLGGLSNPARPSNRLAFGLFLCLPPLIVLGSLGCSPQPPTNKAPAKVLRVGVLPDQNEAANRERYAPLLDYLSKKLGIPAELTAATSYVDLVNRFETGEIQLARFGAVTYVQANQRCGAKPLVMRDVDTRFTSYFLVPGDSPALDLDDLHDTPFSFGAELSTSGHYMPRYFIHQQQNEHDEFFSEVTFSGAHDATAYLVRDKKVAGGAANSRIIDQMMADGRLKSGDIRILWETPPYADYVWATSATMNEARRGALLDAFLEILPGNEETEQILDSLGAESHFLPASDHDFRQVRSVVEKLSSPGIERSQ